MSTATHQVPAADAAVVWIDHWHARVAHHDGGQPAILDVLRTAEPEAAYVHRVAEIARDCARLIILGPDAERLELGRECAAVHGQDDLFVELEAAASASTFELLDRLRLLEGDELARPVG